MRGDDDAAVGRQGCHELANLRIERLDLGDISRAVLVEVGRVRRVGLRQSGSDVVDIGHGIAEALPAVRVESAVVMVVVIVALGMRLVFVVVMIIVHRCLGMLIVVVVVIMVIMTGLGMLIVMIVMPGLFGVGFVAAAVIVLVVVLVVERDRLDAFGRHHAHAVEVGGVDQTVEPAFELQPVDHKDLRFADGSRIGRGRLVDMRVPVRADERRDGDVLAADALYHVAEDREGGDHRGRPMGLCDGRSGERQGEEGGGGRQKRSAGGHGNSFQASRWRRGKARPARPPTGPKTSDSA